VWSPDGTKILFVSLGYVDGAFNVDVYVMNADGSQRVRLTTTAGGDFEPSWSPDSRKIAFSSQRNGREEIYIINADGTGEHRLHAAEASVGSEQYPAWSPDGTKIAFARASQMFNLQNVYTANADGSGLSQVTHIASGLNVSFPDWGPHPLVT
jgi:TolB protein